MRYLYEINIFFRRFRGLFAKKSQEIQPKDILIRLHNEIEKRKKLGIEENAFVPNVYAVYLSPFDYEEISPLLSGIKEQLKNKLTEKIKKKGYRLLSSSISLEIREDSALEKNQVVIESSFLKEKTTTPPLMENQKETTTPLSPSLQRGELKGGSFPGGKENMPEPVKNVLTNIIEDKKTMIIDNTKLKLEIVEGTNKGDVIALKEGEYTFGRGKDAVILIKDSEDTISRVHFKITVRDNRVSIKDLNSSNGTKVNDIDMEDAELKKGDTITAGKVMLKVA